MMRIALVIALLYSVVNSAFAAAKPALDSLSVGVQGLNAAADVKVPAPSAPAKEAKNREQRAIWMCSYMFGYGQAGESAVGLFAFDMTGEGDICEVPISHGQVGPYNCKENGAIAAATTDGTTALLFRTMRTDGASLYHQLNVPSDFAALSKFRGRMRMSGKPPADLAKPVEHSGDGVYQLSCKTQNVAVSPD